MGNTYKYLLFWAFFLIIITQFIVVSAQDNESNYSEKVDSEVYNQLNNSEWVRVIVDVDSKDSINNILSQISESELKFKHEMMFRGAFVAEINEQGLRRLLDSSNILKISYDRVAYTAQDQTSNETKKESKTYLPEKQYKTNKLKLIVYTLLIIIILFVIWFFLIKKKRGNENFKK